MHVRYRVELDESERQQLEALVAGGPRGVRRVKRAQILLAAAAGSSDETIAVTVQVGTSTVYRTKRRLVEEGLAAALYETFPPAESRRILRRVEFHYVPKHASWLNMVEIEIGVLVGQCLDCRIPDRTTLAGEVGAWTRRRNDAGAAVNWIFGIEQARTKLARAYPTPAAAAEATAA
jgi:hypothetical protein